MRITQAMLPSLTVLQGFGLNRHVRGWNRLLKSLFPHDRQPAGRVMTRQWGISYLANPANYIDWNVLCFGSYEANDLAVFRQLVTKRSAVCLDVGANVGHHALFFGSLGWKVHAFEPNPKLWPEFEAKVAASHLTNITLHRIGLAAEDGELAFELENATNSGTGRFIDGSQPSPSSSSPVGTLPIRQGDQYLEEIGVGRVDVIKMDIQGFEPEALQGLHATILRDRPMVSVEIAPDNIAKFGSLTGLAAYFPDGYRFLRVKVDASGLVRRSTLVAIDADDFQTMDGNLFCVPA